MSILKRLSTAFSRILDYADDISLLSHRYSDIQRKSDELARNAEKIGLQININKTKMLRNNSQTADPITIGGKDIEEVTEFTYLGAKVSTYGNLESESKARIRKARGAFAALKNIWKTNKISNRTKIRLFKSIVLSVLLYAAESWKVTKGICQMLEVFPKQVPQEDTANLLAKQNLQHGSP